MEQYTHDQRKALREIDWTRNVRPEFKGLTNDQIRAKLAPVRNNLVFAFNNALRDFNFGGIIRVSNAFACRSVIYSGFRKYDPRGAVGTLNYEDIYHFPSIEDFKAIIMNYQNLGYSFVVAESDMYDKSVLLPHFRWDDKTVLMLGEEGTGVPEEFIDMADVVVTIPQVGSVNSMNVASTAHILAYDYMKSTGRF